MVKYLILTLIAIAMISLPMTGFSQEEDVEYSYGTVVEVKKDSNEIVISEYDWETDEEAEVTYSIHKEAKVENINSWMDIPAGSYIDIEYIVEGDKKVAKYIYVYEPESTEIE